MLNSDWSPVKPAASVAIAACCAWFNCSNGAFTPISRPPKTSCSMGDAIAMMPMPAVTFRQRTAQTSQNCGVFKASLRPTLRVVIDGWVFGSQPWGFQPAAGNR